MILVWNSGIQCAGNMNAFKKFVLWLCTNLSRTIVDPCDLTVPPHRKQLPQLGNISLKTLNHPKSVAHFCQIDYLCTPPGCWETGGASGVLSSLTPQEMQHDSCPEVNRITLLLPSASKEIGTSEETHREHVDVPITKTVITGTVPIRSLKQPPIFL